MQPDHRSTSFHPHFSTWLASPEQLERTLVGHHEILRDFLARLQGVEKGGPANHFLLIGPRGIGKTHLICLGSHYVMGRAPKPNDWTGPSGVWISVLFAEEEYAGQNSLANFLLTLFVKLRDAMPLEELWNLPKTLHDEADQQIIECCFERLERFHIEKGTKVLLLIDNLQKILSQWSEDDHQKLRSFLSRNNLLVIFGSAPSVFREVIDQKAAFHDFFEIRILAELSNEQVLELLSRRFKEEGRQTEFESRKEELARKIPAIVLLTGGNPRLVLFLYEIATRSAFLDVEKALFDLMEKLHEYFERRLADLPGQARKVLDTMAQMPGPATPTEIAREARLSLALVNAQLKRLKEGYYVQPAKFQRKKTTYYDISERLFRIWRQTATVAGKQRFKFLADFLKIYFTPEEIHGLYSQRLEFLRNAKELPRKEIIRCIDELYYIQAACEGRIHYEAFSKRISILSELGELRLAEEEAQYFAAESLKNKDNLGMTSAYKAQAMIHTQSGRYAEAATYVEKLIQVGEYQDAIAAAEKLVSLSPASSDAWILLAVTQGILGNHAQALSTLQKAKEASQPTSELLRYQAIALNALNRYDEALKIAEQAVAVDPRSTRAWEELGLTAYNTGRYEQALEAFCKAQEVGRPTSILLLYQAFTLNALNRREEGLKCAEQAVAMDDKNGNAWEELGISASISGNHDRALAAFQKAETLGRSTCQLLACKAVTLASLQHGEEALKCAEQAVAKEEKNAKVWELLGLLKNHFGHYDQALVAFNKALELGIPTSSLWLSQTFVMHNLKRWDDALRCAEKAVAMDEKNARAWEELGIIAYSLDDQEKALMAFSKVKELGGDSSEIRRMEAETLLKLHRTEDSLSVLDQALGSGTDSPDLWQLRAWTLLELGRFDEALSSIERAREKGATPREYHHDRGDLLLLSGRYAEALKDLEEGQKEAPDDWDLQSDRQFALGCLGQLGPLMEALPAALAQIPIPLTATSNACKYAYNVTLNALRRGEKQVGLGLLRTTLEMETWTTTDWFGKQLGSFLRRSLDTQPQLFVELVQMVRDHLKNENVAKLLEPFLKAAEFLQTKNVAILERVFPEVRDLVLDIVKRVNPPAYEQFKRLI